MSSLHPPTFGGTGLLRDICLLCLLICGSTLQVCAADPAESLSGSGSGLEVRETDSTITVTRDGAVVVVYNKRSPELPAGVDPAYQRSGFLHPVVSPRGSVVTAQFPADHRHQDGVFSAWVNTTWNDRKIDFWNLAGGTGRVLHQRVTSVFHHETVAGFEVRLLHRVVEPPAADVLSEHWTITVQPGQADAHCFDLTTTQTALTDVPLLVQQHRYGGVAVRGPSSWLLPRAADVSATSEPGQETVAGPEFLNDRGSDRVQGNHEKARWVAMTGPVDDQPTTVSVLCHPDNFRAPQAARLHPSKPYFCFAPCVEGAFVIDRQHPYRARYRFLITDAAPDHDWLDARWHDWCRESSP